MITVISKLFRNLRLCNQMLVFSMHRNRVQRIYQRINQLDIFLARMSADMYIFENHICALAHQFIDHTGNRFLISRNRMGTEYNGIIWLNGNFTVHAGCHAGQCGHGLSLASRCNDNRLFIRIIFQLIHINQNVIRQGNISQFRSDGYNIDHASSLNRNFSAKLVCRIDDLLHTIHIGCKCRNNNSCIFMLGKNVIQRFSY